MWDYLGTMLHILILLSLALESDGLSEHASDYNDEDNSISLYRRREQVSISQLYKSRE